MLHHGPLRRPHRRALCRLLNVGVLPRPRGPLLLGFAEAPAAPPVKLVHLQQVGKRKSSGAERPQLVLTLQGRGEGSPLSSRTMVRAMKEKTAIPVNSTVGISITTAEPTLVPKKEIAAIQPLQGDGNKQSVRQPGSATPQPASSPPHSSSRLPPRRAAAEAPSLLKHHEAAAPAQRQLSRHPTWQRAAPALPDAPARDSHRLDNADHQLGHEGEEEGHEAEGAVCPAREGSVTPCAPHCEGRETLPHLRPFQGTEAAVV